MGAWIPQGKGQFTGAFPGPLRNIDNIWHEPSSSMCGSNDAAILCNSLLHLVLWVWGGDWVECHPTRASVNVPTCILLCSDRLLQACTEERWRQKTVLALLIYRVGQEKSKPLEYVNKTEKIGGTWTNMNSYRENEATSDIFMWNILYRNFLFKYSMTESSQWNYCKTDTNKLHKHDIINVCSIEYLTTKIEFMLPTFKCWRFTKL